MRRTLVAVVYLSIIAVSVLTLAQARASIPARYRAALGRCLRLADGETHRFEARGTRLVNRYAATGRFGRQSFRDEVLYVPDGDHVRFGCGPRTQHGQSCSARLGADGALVVTVVYLGYRGVVASTRAIGATACAPATAP